jgi:hypothetical protein
MRRETIELSRLCDVVGSVCVEDAAQSLIRERQL